MRIRIQVKMREETKVMEEIWEIQDSFTKDPGGSYVFLFKKLFTTCKKAVIVGVGL